MQPFVDRSTILRGVFDFVSKRIEQIMEQKSENANYDICKLLTLRKAVTRVKVLVFIWSVVIQTKKMKPKKITNKKSSNKQFELDLNL